jgi:hypothetical protein
VTPDRFLVINGTVDKVDLGAGEDSQDGLGEGWAGLPDQVSPDHGARAILVAAGPLDPVISREG